MAFLRIAQGTTRTIVITDIVSADGSPLDVTTWTVHAAARRDNTLGEVVAEWHTAPTDDQLTATASGDEISLPIPADVSSEWDWTYALLHVEITEPSPGSRVERVAGATLYLDREVVTDG